MKCRKCGGFMIIQSNAFNNEAPIQHRCYNCSNYEDETILFNRIVSVMDMKERQSGPHTPRRYKYDSEGRRVY